MKFIRVQEDEYEAFQMPSELVRIVPWKQEDQEKFPSWVTEHMTCEPHYSSFDEEQAFPPNMWKYYFDTVHGHMSYIQEGDWFVGTNGKLWIYSDEDFKRMFVGKNEI